MPINNSNVPEGTKSFTIYVDDITYPLVHWMAVDIESAVLSNGFSETDYRDALEGHILDEASITTTYRHAKQDDPDPEDGYTLTLQAGTGGTITQGVSGGYQAGSWVYITATPNSGYRFTGWTTGSGGRFDNASSAGTYFVMPASNTTVTANFTSTGTSGGSSGGSGGSGGSSYSGNSYTGGGSSTGSFSAATGSTVNASTLRRDVESAAKTTAGSTVTATSPVFPWQRTEAPRKQFPAKQ